MVSHAQGPKMQVRHALLVTTLSIYEAINLRKRGFWWFWAGLDPGFLARNKANSVAIKTNTISIQADFEDPF